MRTAYDIIYRDLRRDIESGIYEYKELLPSQSELVGRYGCAHNTVRRALSLLTEQGYCQPIHGKGVRVIYRRDEADEFRAHFVTGDVEKFYETATRNMLDAHTVVKAFEHLTCDDELSRLSGFSTGEELLHVERIRILNGHALIRDRSFFDARAVSGLTVEQAEHSVYEYLEDVRNIRIATSKRSVTVEPPTPEDNQWLDIGDYDLLAVVHRRTFDGDGLMFEFTQSRHHPKYFCFRDIAFRRR